MKNRSILLIVAALSLVPIAAPGAAGNEPFPGGAGYGMMRGMMGHGALDREFMQDLGCPMMMNLHNVIDDYLRYKKEIGLNPQQEKSLKDLRQSYQKDITRLNAELMIDQADLRNILFEDEIDMEQVRSASAKLEKVQGEIRNKNIETFIAARRQLTEEQTQKAKDRGIRQNAYDYYDYANPTPMEY